MSYTGAPWPAAEGILRPQRVRVKTILTQTGRFFPVILPNSFPLAQAGTVRKWPPQHRWSLLLHPGVLRIVAPGAIAALFSGQYPGVMQLVARRSHHGMITFGQQHRIAITNHKNG